MNHQSITPTKWPRDVPPSATSVEREGVESEVHVSPLASLKEFFLVVSRSWRQLGLWLVICFAAAGWYLYSTPPRFYAAATILLEPRRQSAPSLSGASVASPASTLDSAQVESQMQVIKSERTLSSVFDLLNLNDAPEFADTGPGLRERLLFLLGSAPPSGAVKSPGVMRARAFQAFSDRVAVRRIGQSYVLDVSYEANSPAEAARIANAVVMAYIKSEIDAKAAAANTGAEFLRERIADIRAAQSAALDAIQSGQVPTKPFPDASARIIGAARPPLAKSSPKTGLTLAFALTLGLLVGLFVIAIRYALDRTIRTRAQVWTALGVNCVAVLPDVTRTRGMRRSRHLGGLGRAVVNFPESSFADAIRATRTAIAPLSRREHRAIGIVSWSQGEGRSVLAYNVAEFMAASGRKVELIDADLRNPSLTKILAPGVALGLNEILTDHNRAPRHEPIVFGSGFKFLPAIACGHTRDHSAHFDSPQMQSLLAMILTNSDVVIDLPPIQDSSDVQALSHLLDGVVLVIESGRTSIENAREAIQSLRAADAQILGVVLNRASTKAARR